MTRWTAETLRESAQCRELVAAVQDALDRRRQLAPDRRPALQVEREQLDGLVRGWSQSLGNPDLALATRRQLEIDMAGAQERLESIRAELKTIENNSAKNAADVDYGEIADRLNRLGDLLGLADPTRANVELSLHIDKIIAHDDGRVVVRTCKVSALAGAVEALRDETEKDVTQWTNQGSINKSIPRHRARLRVHGVDDNGNNLDDAVRLASDVHRFDGLGPNWFWEDVFHIPEPTYWAKENAAAVADKRTQGMTHQALAEHFGVSVPTIRHALQIANNNGTLHPAVPRKMARAKWQELHYESVAREVLEGKSIKDLVSQFGVCQPTISKAIKLARQRGLLPSRRLLPPEGNLPTEG